jgi:NitT/TauT family transport system substrate-binding protein
LKGKKVAYAHGGPSDYFLFKVLQSAGLKVNDVRRIAVDDPSRAGELFLSGDVDAAVTWEPFLTNAAKSGRGQILVTTKEYPGIIVDILVASDKLVKNPKILREFIAGWLKSVEFIVKTPDEAASIMAKGLNVPLDDVKGMMAGLKYANLRRNKSFFNNEDPKKTKLANLFNQAGSYWESC